MIVKCEQCQTRFKIPDDKVTEKGVKVRCTKCQHTFRVKKEGADASGAPAAGPASDPFEKFGAGAGPEPGEETRPAMYALGVQATKTGDVTGLAPSYAAQADLPREAFEGPTRVRSMPPPPPGRKPLTDPAPFDFSALAPPAAPAAAPASKASAFEPQPFDFSSLPASPPPASAPRPAPAAQKPSAFEPQPFDFSALSAPAAPAPAAAEQSARHKPPAKPSAFEPQPFDFSSLGSEPAAAPPPAPKPAAKPAAAPSSFDPQPFDFSSLDSGAPPPPPPPLPPAPPQRQSAPAPKPPPSAPKRPPTQVPSAPPPQPAPSFDLGPAMDFGDPPPAVTQTEIRSPPPPPSGGGLLGDIPVDSSSLAGDLEPGLEAAPEQRGALFDMSSVPEPTNQLQASEPSEQVAVAKIALKKVTADQLAKPKADEGAVSSSRRPKRSVVGVVWNMVSGVVLLGLLAMLLMVLLNEGKVDAALSWSKVKSLFTTPRELVAFDISNGLYDTRAGRPVFYVRGEVKNRGANAGKVKVKAEILDGEDLVRAAEGWVGATPSPEDLYAVATADDLTQLATKLAPSATALKPGTEGSFLVAFYEYPPDLKDFRVRVTVTPEDGSTAAR